MARFKHYDYSQLKLIPVSFQEQILPGTFEYTVNCLVDHEVDLTVFEARYQNEETGAPAYDPAILLKIILYAYSKGVSSSREMARLCQEHVVFMALSADISPTTSFANATRALRPRRGIPRSARANPGRAPRGGAYSGPRISSTAKRLRPASARRDSFSTRTAVPAGSMGGKLHRYGRSRRTRAAQ